MLANYFNNLQAIWSAVRPGNLHSLGQQAQGKITNKLSPIDADVLPAVTTLTKYKDSAAPMAYTNLAKGINDPESLVWKAQPNARFDKNWSFVT